MISFTYPPSKMSPTTENEEIIAFQIIEQCDADLFGVLIQSSTESGEMYFCVTTCVHRLETEMSHQHTFAARALENKKKKFEPPTSQGFWQCNTFPLFPGLGVLISRPRPNKPKNKSF
jgi:hypothetical protein